MSQDVSTEQSALDPLELLSEPSTWASESDQPLSDPVEESNCFQVEVYAASLMDELFEDVDQILETGIQEPEEPAHPEFVSLQPMVMPTNTLPAMRTNPEAAIAPAESDVDLVVPDDETQPRLTSGRSLDRLLLVATCGSLALTALLWFMFQGRWQNPSAPAPVASSSEQIQTQADQDFLDYMQRSLEAIERQAAANQPVASADVPQTTVAVPGTSGGTQVAQAPQVLERIYVPVYQQPQAWSLPGLGQLIPPTAPTQPTAPPQAVSPVSPTPNPVAAAPVPNIAPLTTHTLVGLLELGDRSAALFEINGTTQRIYVGESIGSSGWTLAAVQNQEALVRRNGEVRSIFVGQQF